MAGPNDISLRVGGSLRAGGPDTVGPDAPATAAAPEPAHDHSAAAASRPLIAASGALAGLAQMLRVEAAATPLARGSRDASAATALENRLESIEGEGPKWLSFTDSSNDVKRLAKRLGKDGRISAKDIEGLVRAAKDFKSISKGERRVLLDVLHGKHGALASSTQVALARFLGVTAPIAQTGPYKLTPLLNKHRAFQQVQAGDRELGTGDYGKSIADMQRVLAQLGYGLRPDGKFGPATARMLKRFQQDHGIPTSGKLDQTTLRSLSQAVDGVRPVQTTTTNDKTDVKLDVPFYHQFDKARVERAGKTACFRATKAMVNAYLKQSGVRGKLQGVGSRIDVGTRESRNGDIITTRAKADAARGYIDRALAKGLPLIVGLSHSSGNAYNANATTDHFVVITGKGVDENGRTYYTFNDPATTSPTKGRGRFYVDADGKLEKAGTRSKRSFVSDRHFEVSEVRTWEGVS